MVSPMTRDMYGIDFHDHSHWVALSGLEWIDTIIPRALPWAGMDRPVGAGMNRPVGAGMVRPVGASMNRPVGAGMDRPVGASMNRPVGAGLIESNMEEQADA
jgi:hypothetical protein